ncbi:MAG: hypothetical protein ABIX28_16030 [Vicinamibacterales bacterium]
MRAGVIRGALYGGGLLVLMLTAQSGLAAGISIQAPEIDGSSLTTGLGLLTAAVLIVRSRSRK